MSIILRCFAFSALIFLILQPSVKGLQTLYKTHSFPNKQVIFSRESLQDTRFVYAVCEEHKENQTSQDCKVTNEQNRFDTSSDVVSCDIKVIAKYSYIKKQHRVIPFGKNSAIFVWFEYTNNTIITHLNTIRFETCAFSEAEVVVSTELTDLKDVVNLDIFVPIVTYDGIFKVIFHSKDLCRNKMCITTFDAFGNKINGPSNFYDSTRALLFEPIFTNNSSTTKYTLFESSKDEETINHILLGSDGKGVIINSHKFDDLFGNHFTRSTSNELLGLCVVGAQIVNCTQYNVNGDLIVEASLTFGKSHTHALAMLNLRHGGFLYMRSFSKEFIDYGQYNYYIVKADQSGKQIGHLDLGKLICRYELSLKFVEIAEDEHCIILACHDYSEPPAFEKNVGQFNVTTKCFTDQDFIKAN